MRRNSKKGPLKIGMSFVQVVHTRQVKRVVKFDGFVLQNVNRTIREGLSHLRGIYPVIVISEAGVNPTARPKGSQQLRRASNIPRSEIDIVTGQNDIVGRERRCLSHCDLNESVRIPAAYVEVGEMNDTRILELFGQAGDANLILGDLNVVLQEPSITPQVGAHCTTFPPRLEGCLRITSYSFSTPALFSW